MVTTQKAASDQVWNVPNSLSLARLALALLVGLLIEWEFFASGMIAFLIAVSTDFLDGWWARRFDQITKLGRVLDPFVDKIIITAALVALVGVNQSGIPAWMVTVIIAREFLVTTLRAMVEGQGGDFSARWMGKWKFVFQSAAVVASLIWLWTAVAWTYWATIGLSWIAVGLTIASGADYVVQAVRLYRLSGSPSA